MTRLDFGGLFAAFLVEFAEVEAKGTAFFPSKTLG